MSELVCIRDSFETPGAVKINKMLIKGNGKNVCVFNIESTSFFFADFGRGGIAQYRRHFWQRGHQNNHTSLSSVFI